MFRKDAREWVSLFASEERISRREHLSMPNLVPFAQAPLLDGPSFPAVDTRDFMRPSLVHDCLYQAAKEGLLPHSQRKTFDELLRLHCRADGMFGARAWWVHRAVRTFGGPVMRKPEKVLVAPAPKYRRPLSEYARGRV